MYGSWPFNNFTLPKYRYGLEASAGDSQFHVPVNETNRKYDRLAINAELKDRDL